MATQASFDLTYADLRVQVQLAGVVILLVGLYRALPIESVVFALLLVRPMLRLPPYGARVRLSLAELSWHQVWMCQYALCVIGEQKRWVFRDELKPEEWARLRRQLILHTPRTPWGLSISR